MKRVIHNRFKPMELLQALLEQSNNYNSQTKAAIRKIFSKYESVIRQNETDKETIRRLRIQNKKMLERISVLAEQLKQAKLNRNQALNRMSDMRKLNKSLASALGSCPVCWGEDAHCEYCTGEGIPGWTHINKRMFNHYILPVLEKVYGFKK